MSKPMTKIVVDLANLPPLTPAQTAELATLATMSDDSIDLSDSPILTESFWSQATRNPFLESRKVSTSVDIEADVLAWLRSEGGDYLARINAILRREMIASRTRRA